MNVHVHSLLLYCEYLELPHQDKHEVKPLQKHRTQVGNVLWELWKVIYS